MTDAGAMKILAFVALGLVACGGGEDDGDLMTPGSQMCAERDGAYRVTYREQSGDCGEIPSTLVVVDATAPAGAGDCTTTSRKVASDNCSTTYVATCPFNGEVGWTSEFTYALSFARDGDSGYGTTSIVVYDARRVAQCASVYGVIYDRP